MNRRTFLSLLNTLFVAVGLAAVPARPAAAAPAPGIRYFVAQAGGAYEVIEGSNTGGRFVNRRTGEQLPILTAGVVVPVLGYTDRISRGEGMYCIAAGYPASGGCILANGQLTNQWRSVIPAGWGFGVIVPIQPYIDDVYILLNNPNGGVVGRRITIGRR